MKKSDYEHYFLGSGEVITVALPDGGWRLVENTIQVMETGPACIAIWPGKTARRFWGAYLSLDSNNRLPRGMQRKARKGGRHGRTK